MKHKSGACVSKLTLIDHKDPTEGLRWRKILRMTKPLLINTFVAEPRKFFQQSLILPPTHILLLLACNCTDTYRAGHFLKKTILEVKWVSHMLNPGVLILNVQAFPLSHPPFPSYPPTPTPGLNFYEINQNYSNKPKSVNWAPLRSGLGWEDTLFCDRLTKAPK